MLSSSMGKALIPWKADFLFVHIFAYQSILPNLQVIITAMHQLRAPPAPYRISGLNNSFLTSVWCNGRGIGIEGGETLKGEFLAHHKHKIPSWN